MFEYFIALILSLFFNSLSLFSILVYFYLFFNSCFVIIHKLL
jgi:hypothetical protein